MVGYVVLDQALTSSTPQGRPDVFRSLQLRVSNIRYGGRHPIVSAVRRLALPRHPERALRLTGLTERRAAQGRRPNRK
jgi:hypothetical protein